MAAAATCGTGTGSTGSVVATARKNNVTSFQRRSPRSSGTDSTSSRLVSIAGTRPSLRNGQLLVSTGLPALDQLLGRFGTELWAQTEGKLREGTCGGSRSTPNLSLTLQPSNVERIAQSDRDGGEEGLRAD